MKTCSRFGSLFIAADNPEAADRLPERVGSLLALLLNTPKAGRLRPELGEEIRSFPMGAYILFHRESDQGVELVRFLSARMDFDADEFV